MFVNSEIRTGIHVVV